MKDMLPRWFGEMRAALVLASVIILIVGAAALRRSGPSIAETAQVIRFGSHADEFGDHPTAIVKLVDGSEVTIVAPPGSLIHCTPGSTINLARRPFSLIVAPTGCR